MKRIIILLLALIFTSCSALLPTYYPQKKQAYATFLDFRPYTSEGFFISPDPYTGEFEPLGQLYVEVFPEEKLISAEDRYKYDETHYYGSDLYGFERLSYAEILSQAVVRAVSMGANGIADLKISKVTYNGYVRYEASGLCIIIKKGGQ